MKQRVLISAALVHDPDVLILDEPLSGIDVSSAQLFKHLLTELARQADVLVAAIGKPETVTADWVKPGATVVDVGIHRVPAENRRGGTRLVGDVEAESVARVAGALTPVPGGVGPMTVAMLVSNTVRAAKQSAAARV